MSGVAQLGANSGDPRHRIDSNDQFIDSFSWKLNKHDVKFGFDFHRTTVDASGLRSQFPRQADLGYV